MDSITKTRLFNTIAVRCPVQLPYSSIPGPDDPGSATASHAIILSGVRHDRA